jgi:hypothetical protein
MKRLFLSLVFLPLISLFFLLSVPVAYAETRVQPLSYEPVPCSPDCTTLRIYYNLVPPDQFGWSLANWGGLMWSGSAGATNIHDTYADYTWVYPNNLGTARVVFASGDNASSPFTIDFSITQPTLIPPHDSVEVVGYEFIPCGNPTCATVRIYYDQVPPAETWGLVNWQNHTMWSGAAGATNTHDTYADYTIHDPFVLTVPAQFVLASADDFSFPFTIDWSSRPVNTAPAVQSLANATITEGDTYTTTGFFTDPDSTSWTGTVDYGDGSGVQPLEINQEEKTFILNHQYLSRYAQVA